MYPFIHILGRSIGTYGLCLAVAFSLVYFLSLRKGKRYGLIAEDLLIVGAFSLCAALIGGALVYILVTYSLAEIAVFIMHGDFHFLGSGLVFYGGLIGGLIGAIAGIRVSGCKFSVIERAVVPFIPLGYAIGRIGCVMAGCCYGFAYDGPFALYYQNSLSGLLPEQGYFPVQPLESLINVGICMFLLWYEKKVKRVADLLFTYLAMYAVLRFVLEILRGDDIRGIWGVLSTSQIISVILLCISITGLLWKNKPKIQ